MTEKKVMVKNLKVNYKVFGLPAQTGEGRPMLILHGWPSSSEKWIKVGELLSQHGIKVIIPDLPGFGKSQEPTQAWNTDNYIEWIRDFADTVDDLKKEFYLLGHSFGGSLAAKFTIKYNQRISKLFLVSAACVRESTFSKKFYYKVSKLVKIFSFLPYYSLVRKTFYKFIIRKSDYPYVRGVMKDTYIKVVSEDLSHRLSFIKNPTTIIWGGKDDSTPVADAEFIHSKIKNSTLLVIPDKKHSLQIEAPEILAEKILKNI